MEGNTKKDLKEPLFENEKENEEENPFLPPASEVGNKQNLHGAFA